MNDETEYICPYCGMNNLVMVYMRDENDEVLGCHNCITMIPPQKLDIWLNQEEEEC